MKKKIVEETKANEEDKEDKDIDTKTETTEDLNVYSIDYDDSKLNQGETKYPLSSPVHFHIIKF